MQDEFRERAQATAKEILSASADVGPIDVKYVKLDQDVPDDRYLIVLFDGQKALLVDKKASKNEVLDLGYKSDPTSEMDLARAKNIAARERLMCIYVTKI